MTKAEKKKYVIGAVVVIAAIAGLFFFNDDAKEWMTGKWAALKAKFSGSGSGAKKNANLI